MALRTPLYDWHRAHGGRMVDFAGWDMPVQYTSITDEHAAVRTAAGLFDISHMGRLVIEGPGALDLIQRVWTNDAASMRAGQVRYGLLCNERGGIRDDVLVYRFEPFWLMVVNASNREKILGWLDQQRGGHDVKVTDKTFDWPMLAVQGPHAAALLEDKTFRFRFWTGSGMGMDELRNYQACMLRHFAKPEVLLIVSRTGYTGEDGFELVGAFAGSDNFVDSLGRLFQEKGIPLTPCGLGARDTLRLEAAMPLYGHELTEETDPYQAGLAWAVKPDKGAFIGRDALLRRRDDPSLPRRVGLELEGKRIAREGAAVLRDGREVGRVTSGTFAPTLGRVIAMAYVAPEATAAGTALAVDVRGQAVPARVVPLPFYRRPKAG